LKSLKIVIIIALAKKNMFYVHTILFVSTKWYEKKSLKKQINR